MHEPLLRASELTVRYGGSGLLGRKDPFEALCGIDFEIFPGEAFAIVGESGAGKTTAVRCVVGLQRPSAGTIVFAGRPLNARRNRDQRRAIQVVFQDPYSSLNPRMTVGAMLTELLMVNRMVPGRAEAGGRAAELLAMVGMPESALSLRPGAFSGGQRQRIGIARALALDPILLVADEPVSALDVSIQAQILLLLKRLQTELGLTMLFISHDLAVIHQLCDRVAVMSEGRIIEQGPVAQVFADPEQEFTRDLLAAATELPSLELSVPAR